MRYPQARTESSSQKELNGSQQKQHPRVIHAQRDKDLKTNQRIKILPVQTFTKGFMLIVTEVLHKHARRCSTHSRLVFIISVVVTLTGFAPSVFKWLKD